MTTSKGRETTQNSPELLSLYERARGHVISTEAFLMELDNLGITDFSQAFHLANAFDISLNEAKKIFIERQPGGMDAWEKQLDELDLNDL